MISTLSTYQEKNEEVVRKLIALFSTIYSSIKKYSKLLSWCINYHIAFQ